VLVEADPSDVEPKAMQDDDHAGNARFLVRLRECRDAVVAGRPLPLLPPRPGQPRRTCAQQFFRGLPEAEWSPELNAKLLQLAQSKVAMYDAYISEMEEMPWDEAWLKQHVRSLGSRPVRVLTTGNHGVGHLPARNAHDTKHIEYGRQIALAQARWLTLSSNAKQIFLRDSSEYIELDDPKAVVDAIREAYSRSSNSSTFRDCPECPEMVVVPAGNFVMGSSASEKSWGASNGGNLASVADESPQHNVSLRSFALGKYDVTRAQYEAFVRNISYSAAAGCGRDSLKWNKELDLSWQNPGFVKPAMTPWYASVGRMLKPMSLG
jgi:formylglycine-generating enzyme required for sulfatase activity